MLGWLVVFPTSAWNGLSVAAAGHVQLTPPSIECVCTISVRSDVPVPARWSYHIAVTEPSVSSAVMVGKNWQRSLPGLALMATGALKVTPPSVERRKYTSPKSGARLRDA